MTETSESLRRAALLLSSLDRATAELLLKQLEPHEAQRLQNVVVDLGKIDPRDQHAAIETFLNWQSSNSAGQGNPTNRHALATGSKALHRRDMAHSLAGGHRIPSSPRSAYLATDNDYAELDDDDDDSPPFGMLHEATAAQLSMILQGEHPQTIAVVVWHLPPQRAVELLDKLPDDVQIEVVRRLSDLDHADPEVLREVEKVLHLRITEREQSERRHAAGVQFLMRALEAAPRTIKQNILANVAQHDHALAGRLVAHCWTADDVELLSNRDLAQLLSTAPQELVVLSIAGATAELAERMLSVVPGPRAAALRQAVESLPPTRLADLEQAQHSLARIAEQLATSGQIEPPKRRYASAMSR